MPQKRYTVQAPDGRTVTLEGPEGADQKEVIAQAQRLLGAAPPPEPNIIQTPEGKFVDRRSVATRDIQAMQAAKYPSSQELGQGGKGIEGAGQFLPELLGDTARNLAIDPNEETFLGKLKNLPATALEIAKAQMFQSPDIDTGIGDPNRPRYGVAQPFMDVFKEQGFGAGAGKVLAVPAAIGLTMGAAKTGKVLAPEVQAFTKSFAPPRAAQVLEQRAAKNFAKAMQPTTLEDKAVLQRISPEAVRRRLSGVTGRGIDKEVSAGLREASDNLAKVHEAMRADPRPEAQIPTEPMIAKLQDAVAKLSKEPQLHAAAIDEFQQAIESMKRLPKYANFEDVFAKHLAYDNAVDFRQLANDADKLRMTARRGVADVIRTGLNENTAHPELKVANQEFSLYKHLDDIAKRRELGNVGKTGLRLPGRGTILDDVLAGWAGEALGGNAGAAMMEGLNLLGQSRGWANIRSRFQMKLADALRQAPAKPKGLLPPAPPQLPPIPDTSGVMGLNAKDFIQRRLLKP